jgi:Flp pilus assembly protein TadD
VLGDKGQLESALAQAKEAARLAPDDAAVQFRLGKLLLMMGQQDQAQFHLRRAVTLDPSLGAQLGR